MFTLNAICQKKVEGVIKTVSGLTNAVTRLLLSTSTWILKSPTVITLSVLKGKFDNSFQQKFRM